VTDDEQSLTIADFEHVAVGPSAVLLRVNGRSPDPRPAPDWRPTLIAHHGGGAERFAPLPSPPDAEGVLRAAYSVPAAVVTPETRFWLELADREIVELGTPTPGTPRRAAAAGGAGGDADAVAGVDAGVDQRRAEGSDQLVTLSAALAQARERTASVDAENQKLSATLGELEVWRAELERRLADTTTELAETRARLAEAHAAAEMEALVARAEAEALEQAARELTAAAQSGRSAA
jgi:hypothetical protein